MPAGSVRLEYRNHIAIITLEVIRNSQDLPLEDALALELDNAVDLVASGEFVYGISAFLEKKPPEFPE